jgi:predicted cupin superfamily sugar epimerase
MGCTVAPGFEFTDFEFLRDDSDAVAGLARHPEDIQRLA